MTAPEELLDVARRAAAAGAEVLAGRNGDALGVKGIGEAGTIGAPPAVANALADALGAHLVDPPFTAEKVWRALR